MTARRVLVALLCLAAACGGSDDDGTTLRVFAAASLTDVFDDLSAAFTRANPGVDVELVVGPSSGLVAQLRDGAPADVLATADVEAMAAALDLVEGAPAVFARNRPALAVPAGNPGDVRALADLADEDRLVGLCAEEVPCGRLARALLDAAGIVPAVDTEEPDVRALLTKVEAGELDAGIVYATDVRAAGDAVESVPVPEAADLTVEYPIVVVTRSDGADAFADFVRGEQGRDVLTDHGFLPPP